MTTVSFDVDGTLIQLTGENEDTPRYDIITFFHLFQASGCDMFVWSGGGLDYATRWAAKLGLKATLVEKGSFRPDIAVDDMDTNLGKVDIRV